MNKVIWWRPAATLFGAAAGAMGMIAAWEYALILEGGKVTYFVLIAPMIIVAGVVIPPFASYLFKRGEPIVLVLGLWFLLGLCGWFEFSAGAERVHNAKETQAADHRARYAALGRAQSEFDEAKAAIQPLEAAYAKLKWNPQCSASKACMTAKASVEQARERLSTAETAVNHAQREFRADSNLRAPTWLPPLTGALIAFFFVWAGLGGSWVERKERSMTAEEAKGWAKWFADLLRSNAKTA